MGLQLLVCSRSEGRGLKRFTQPRCFDAPSQPRFAFTCAANLLALRAVCFEQTLPAPWQDRQNGQIQFPQPQRPVTLDAAPGLV